ncbi:MAG TPA: DNA polymerase [Xanthobacteraceae bacterium]|nr:DNA polymerase [Xanthobacteraceae bacterium]
MKFVFLDYETFYSKEYTLRRMTPVQYILDPRFEMIGCAVKERRQPGVFLEDAELRAYFASLDPKDTCMVTFNALFDMCITAWKYDFVPKLMVDTMGVARACRGSELKRLNLETVAEHLGLPAKGKTILKVEGMCGAAIKAAGLWPDYEVYALNDNDLNEGIFEKLVESGEFPAEELPVMDMVLRCAIKPRFILDAPKLAVHLNSIVQQKNELLAQAMLAGGVDGKSDLMSNDRFAELLRNVGCEPPKKISPTTGLSTWAFSKTDPDFLALEEDDNPAVQALIAARLGHKSTLEETRTKRLLEIAALNWPGKGQVGLMPVPLRFSGAHTHRLSGEWKINMQNMPARDGVKALRRALTVGPDEEAVVADASQIEARITAWICGQTDLVDAFARGADVYSDFASEVFDQPVNRKAKLPNGDPDPQQVGMGFVGKTGILSLGFGVGWEKFQRSVKILSKQQIGTAIELDDETSIKTVKTYRRKNYRISGAWKTLGAHLNILSGGGRAEFGPCLIEKGSILLPSGLRLFYRDLQQEGGQWRFKYGPKTKFIWGGALLENIVQAIARIVTMSAAVRIQRRVAKYNVWLNLQAHDELVFITPKQHVAEVKKIIHEEMVRRPQWALDLPLAAEVGSGPTYGDAK